MIWLSIAKTLIGSFFGSLFGPLFDAIKSWWRARQLKKLGAAEKEAEFNRRTLERVREAHEAQDKVRRSDPRSQRERLKKRQRR